MTVLSLQTSRARYGGGIYERYLHEALAPRGDLEVVCPVPALEGRLKYLGAAGFFGNLFQIGRRSDVRCSIRALETAFLLPKNTRNIIVAHHYDRRGSHGPASALQWLAFHNLLQQRREVAALVVVSAYWERFFRDLGFAKIVRIYNPFDLPAYDLDGSEIEAFKAQHGLTGKPIVYLGNAQKKKGTDRAYAALRHLDAHLVTSGPKQLAVPTRHLDLDHRGYIALLHASSVAVTMSQFREGWNRVAHEAMLCRTPVVGSGLGGMSELLEGGGQIVCPDFAELPGCVERALRDREPLGTRGRAFAQGFGLDRFEAAWRALVAEFA